MHESKMSQNSTSYSNFLVDKMEIELDKNYIIWVYFMKFVSDDNISKPGKIILWV